MKKQHFYETPEVDVVLLRSEGNFCETTTQTVTGYQGASIDPYVDDDFNF